MPKATEICVVVAGGTRYDIWESVEVSRNYDEFADHGLLTVAEPSEGGQLTTQAALKLKPGDKAQVFLAGEQVLNGQVYLRQAAYDPTTHEVQIGITSQAQNLIPATVSGQPGQYVNQTLQQIASAACAQVGVKFSIKGDPTGADMPFPRVSEHIGETIFDFVNRLARQRDLRIMDDGEGGVVAFRGPTDTSGLVLKEGGQYGNILHARLLLRNNDEVSSIKGLSQDHNQNSADQNRDVSATATVANSTVNRNLTFISEETQNQEGLQMRTNYEAAISVFNTVDGDVTVSGWLCPDGSLWIDHVHELVSLDSPMLVPPDVDNTFMIKGVTHRQDSENGTTTTIFLCDKSGLGAGTGTPLQLNPNAAST